jgi:chromosome partitioning protein
VTVACYLSVRQEAFALHVIAVIAQKGGPGKTTLASCLAVHAASKSKVGLLDLDPQQSLAEWWQVRGEPSAPQLYTGAETPSEAVELLTAKGVDWLFVDTGPGLLHAIEPVIEVADLVLVPVKPSAFDLMAIVPTLQIVQASGKSYLLVLNECISTKMESTAAELLKSEGHPVANTTIKQRVAYRSAVTTGDTGPERDGKCADEISSLWDEIKTAVRRSKHRG